MNCIIIFLALQSYAQPSVSISRLATTSTLSSIQSSSLSISTTITTTSAARSVASSIQSSVPNSPPPPPPVVNAPRPDTVGAADSTSGLNSCENGVCRYQPLALNQKTSSSYSKKKDLERGGVTLLGLFSGLFMAL